MSEKNGKYMKAVGNLNFAKELFQNRAAAFAVNPSATNYNMLIGSAEILQLEHQTVDDMENGFEWDATDLI